MSWMKRAVPLVVMAVELGACGSRAETTAPRAQPPIEIRLDGAPALYDRSPSIPNTQPAADVSSRLGPRARPTRVVERPGGALSTPRFLIAGDQGFAQGAAEGISVGNSLPTGTTLPVNVAAATWVASVHSPGDDTCLQAGALAHRPAGASSATTAYFDARPWAGCGFASGVLEEMSLTWRGKYTEIAASGRRLFYTQVRRLGVTCWETVIWNFLLLAWEQKAHDCTGGGPYSSAATYYDTQNLGSCPTNPTMYVENVLYKYVGTWYPGNFATSNVIHLNDACFASGAYTFVTLNSNSWSARTPNP